MLSGPINCVYHFLGLIDIQADEIYRGLTGHGIPEWSNGRWWSKLKPMVEALAGFSSLPSLCRQLSAANICKETATKMYETWFFTDTRAKSAVLCKQGKLFVELFMIEKLTPKFVQTLYDLEADYNTLFVYGMLRDVNSAFRNSDWASLAFIAAKQALKMTFPQVHDAEIAKDSQDRFKSTGQDACTEFAVFLEHAKAVGKTFIADYSTTFADPADGSRYHQMVKIFKVCASVARLNVACCA